MTQYEIDTIRTYIRAEVANLNWWKTDEFFCFGLSGETNALTGWKSKTATNSGATHSISGFTFNGDPEYIDTNFNAATDGVKFTLDNALISSYMYDTSSLGGWEYMFGAVSDGFANNTPFFYHSNPNIRYGMNEQLYDTYFQPLVNKTNYSIFRLSSTLIRLYKNGGFVADDTSNSTGIANGNIYLGARNLDGVANSFGHGTLLSFLISAGNFQIQQHNTNLNTLLISLGNIYSVEVQAVLDRMTGLSVEEENSIVKFVNAEVDNGNWNLIDEFYMFALNDEVNALTGWKEKTATNNGATHTPSGFTFNGSTDYINSNWNPSTDGNEYQTNDALAGVYVLNGTFSSLFGAYETAPPIGGSSVLNLYGSITDIYRINSEGSANTQFPNHMSGNSLIYIDRTWFEDTNAYINGVLKVEGNNSVTIPPDLNIYIGARNQDGVAVTHSATELSSFIVGAGIGFDHSSHYTNMITLLTELGAI